MARRAMLDQAPDATRTVPIPSSEELVARYLPAFARRTRRLANQMGVLLLAPALFAAVVGGIEVPILLFIFMDLLLAWMVRWRIIHDIRRGERIMRRGTVHRATSMTNGDIGFGSYIFRPRWDDRNGLGIARLDCTRKLEHGPPSVEETLIVAVPRSRFVGIILGENGFFLAPRMKGRLAREHGA
jgi:hypothetical protein